MSINAITFVHVFAFIAVKSSFKYYRFLHSKVGILTAAVDYIKQYQRNKERQLAHLEDKQRKINQQIITIKHMMQVMRHLNCIRSVIVLSFSLKFITKIGSCIKLLFHFFIYSNSVSTFGSK